MNAPGKVQTNESDPSEDRSTATKTSEKQEENKGLAPEKGDSIDPLLTSGGSDVTTETVDNTKQNVLQQILTKGMYSQNKTVFVESVTLISYLEFV